MALSVMSLLPLLVAVFGLQALLVVKVADRITGRSGQTDSHRLHEAPGGRYFGVA